MSVNKPAVTQYGLMAAPAIFWLVAKEREVWQQVIAFITDCGGDKFDVAGPPTIEAVLRHKAYPREGLELPVVRLHMKKVRHHLTGQPMVEMKCNDAHLHDIESWRVLDSYRANELRPDEIKLERKPLN
jgi:hypothetical protein